MIPQTEFDALEGMLLGDLCLKFHQTWTNAMATWGGKYQRTGKAMTRDCLSLNFRPPKCTITRLGYQIWEMHSGSTEFLTWMWLRWYLTGKKMVPRDLQLTPMAVYWWYVGDGSFDPARERITLATNGFERKNVTWLAGKLHERGFAAQVHKQRQGWIIHIPRRPRNPSRGVRGFLDYIGSCRNPEYAYKWGS